MGIVRTGRAPYVAGGGKEEKKEVPESDGSGRCGDVLVM